MCGSAIVSWIQFSKIWSLVVDLAKDAAVNQDDPERLKHSLATRMMTLRTKPMDTSLWNLLRETRDLECADQRDKIYALLSVASEGHRLIKADYHADFLGTAHLVLRNRYASRPPTTLDQVVRDCGMLQCYLKLSKTEMLTYRDDTGRSECVLASGSRNIPSRSWTKWAGCHGHRSVVKLLQDRYEVTASWWDIAATGYR